MVLNIGTKCSAPGHCIEILVLNVGGWPLLVVNIRLFVASEVE